MSGGGASTEAVDPATADLDALDALGVVTAMSEADGAAVSAVRAALPAIARAVEAVTAALRAGGRLVYAGAGTSGRLATLDAVECVPTFGVPPGMVVALVAGGPDALTRSIEGAEDDDVAGARDIRAAGVGPADIVVGVAASGATPYALGAVAEARERGAATVGIACNDPAPLLERVDHPIAVVTGPEVIAGSTRLKAGTAQKLVLNMLSTGAMVGLGKVHGNRMVDVRVTNAKLRRRAIGIVADLAGVERADAERLLDASGLEVRTAVLMGLGGLDAAAARALLATSGGRIGDAISALEGRPGAHPQRAAGTPTAR